MKRKSLLFLVPLFTLVMTGCDLSKGSENPEPSQNQDQPATQNLQFEGIVLEQSKEVYYDGQNHSLALTGVPDGATVTYDGAHEFKEVGEHHVSVTISKEGYDSLTLEGTLTIVALKHFEGVTLNDLEVYYDGQPHSLVLAGVPQGATVTYDGETEFTEIGVHTVSVTISMTGYETLTLESHLTIKALEQFTGVTFTNGNAAYDGQPHSISVSGLPDGADVTYSPGNTFTAPGVYQVTATVSKENYENLVLTANLTISASLAQNALKIDDFEGIGDSDLNSDWKYEVYKDSGWVTPTEGSIKIAKNQEIGDGESTVRFNMKHHGTGWSATKQVGPLYTKYNSIVLDARADSRQENASTTLMVRLQLKDLPLPESLQGYKDTYFTYTLTSNLSTNWTHFEVPFNDVDSLKIAEGQFTAAQLGQLGISLNDLALYVDKVSVILKPNSLAGGSNAYAYIDNVGFGLNTAKAVEEHVNLLGKRYSVKSSDDTVFVLDIADNGNVNLSTSNLEKNLHLNGSLVNEGGELKIVVPTSQTAHFEVALTSYFAGEEVSMAEPTGDLEALAVLQPYQDHFEIQNRLHQIITVDNFESYSEIGNGLDSTHTEAQMSGLRAAYHSDYYSQNDPGSGKSLLNADNWYKMGSTDYLKLETTNVHSGNKAADFKGSTYQMRYMSFGLAKGTAQPIGRGSYLSMWVKGEVETNTNVRAWYVNKVTATNQGSTSGDAAYAAAQPITTEWTQIVLPIDPLREVYGFSLNPAKIAGRIYVDDVEIIGGANPYEAFVETQTVADGTWGVVVGADAYSLELKNGVTEALFGKMGETPIQFTAEMANSKVILKDKTSGGAGVTVTLKISNNDLTVEAVSGLNKADFEGFVNGTLTEYAHVNYDLQSEAANNHQLADPNWKGEYYNSGWVAHPGQMNVRNDGKGNIFCNMTTQKGCNTKFTYTPSKKIGPVNHLSVKLANDFSPCYDVNVKVKVITTNNTEVYAVGDADNFVTVPANTGKRNDNEWFEVDENFALCDAKEIQFILYCANQDYLYFDDLVLDFKKPTQEEHQEEPPVVEKTISDGRYFIWNAATDAFTIDVTDNATKAHLIKVNANPAAESDFTVSQSEGIVTLKDKDLSGAGLTVKAAIQDDGSLKVTDVTGYAEGTWKASLLNKTAKAAIVPNLTFNDGTTGSGYTSSNWSAKQYGASGWEDVETSKVMNCRAISGNKIVNMKADKTTRNFVYNPGKPFGPVKHLKIDLGNYYQSGAQCAIRIKIKLLKQDLDTPDAILTADAQGQDVFQEIEFSLVENVLNTYEFDFDLCVPYALRITTQTGSDAVSYLYVDNIVLS